MREEQQRKESKEREDEEEEEEEGRCVLKNWSLMMAQERSSKTQTKVSKTSKEAFL